MIDFDKITLERDVLMGIISHSLVEELHLYGCYSLREQREFWPRYAKVRG